MASHFLHPLALLQAMKRFRLEDQSAGILVWLSAGGRQDMSASERAFECKTCCRQFSSFQALGGHRASHKKPRLADDKPRQAQSKPKVHECSICGLEFAVGQALGGHMRRHRGSVDGVLVEKKRDGKRSVDQLFDLNLPPNSDESLNRRKWGLGLGLGLGLVDKTPMVGFL